jgi:protein-S-isoprenylcysteine O-methyltransferase Ste14
MKSAPSSFASRLLGLAILVMAALLGGMGQLFFVIFLFFGSLDLVVLDVDEAGVLIFNTCLSLLFFAQHSLMIRRPYRRWLSRHIRIEYHGTLYTIASGVALLTVFVFWQTSAITLANPQGIVRFMMRAVFFLSGVLLVWTLGALRPFDPFGLFGLVSHLRGAEPLQTPFVIRGPYRWVRHPLYLVCLMAIWSGPELTADRMLFNALWTAWLVVGARLEERDLTAEFGDAYRRYQRAVPMLIPRRIPR